MLFKHTTYLDLLPVEIYELIQKICLYEQI